MDGIEAMTDPTRREFLARLSAMGIVAASPASLAAQESYSGRITAQESLPTRVIPGTDEMLPIVGLGSSKPVLQIPEEGTGPLRAVIRTLVQHGGRVVDTSPRVEEIDREFGRLLQAPDLMERLFVATKINTEGAEAGVQQMRQNQRLFGRRTVDLVQVESLRDIDAHWPNLREWKETGEARYIGVTVSSNGAHERLESFMRAESPDFVHVNYSVVETQAEDRLLPLAQDLGMAVLINRPFMNGRYFARVNGRELPEWAADFDCVSWAQFSLKYILAHPAVTCVFTETTSPEHMEENIQAAFGRLPEAVTKRRMRGLLEG